MTTILLTTTLIALVAIAAAGASAEAQYYDGAYDDSPAEWEYGVDLDGK